MDNMGTPGPNHPAYRGLQDKRTENQFSNVLDLHASRVMKESTGVAKPVPIDPSEASSMDKHWATGIRDE